MEQEKTQRNRKWAVGQGKPPRKLTRHPFKGNRPPAYKRMGWFGEAGLATGGENSGPNRITSAKRGGTGVGKNPPE